MKEKIFLRDSLVIYLTIFVFYKHSQTMSSWLDSTSVFVLNVYVNIYIYKKSKLSTLQEYVYLKCEVFLCENF